MKTFFSLFVLLFTLTSYAQVKHLVFDINEFLIQGVPVRNAGLFSDKERVFKLIDGGRDRYYYPAPYAAEAIHNLLKNPQLSVHFVSYYGNREWSKRVLSNIFTTSAKDVSLQALIESNGKSMVLGSEDLDRDKKIKIELISNDLQNIFFFTTKKGLLPKKAEDQEIFTGPSFYVFETFQKAKEEAARVGKIPSIPDNEEDWYFERHRFPHVLFAVSKALKEKKFLSEVRDVLKNRDKKAVSIGIKQTSSDWSEIGPRFVTRFKKVSGCAEFNNITDERIRDLDLNKCVTPSLTSPKLVVSGSTVKACALHTKDEDYFVTTTTLSTCIQELKLPAYWTGKGRTACAYYTAELLVVADAPSKSCEKQHVLKHPKSNQLILIEETDDFDSLTIDQIFTKDDPTLKEPFKLYANYDNKPEVGFTLNACRVPEKGYHTIKTDAQGVLLKECQPDTLYSWGPALKKDSLETWMGNDAWVTSMRPLFMTRSPVATFGYGPIPVRIKLKPNLNWVYTSQAHSICGSVSESDKQTTVYYRTMNWSGNIHLLDYIICSPGPIASWSYGLKEHYDEIVKDYNWIRKKEDREFELYLSGGNQLQYLYGGIDGHDFSEYSLIRYLGIMQSMIKNNSGKVHFNPDIPKDQRTTSEHFKTSIPIYYNHR